jgi:hypothetical protein
MTACGRFKGDWRRAPRKSRAGTGIAEIAMLLIGHALR